MRFFTKNKYRSLALSIILDAIGMIPFIDLLWAPLSGYLMTKLYKGSTGRLAGAFTFIEEIIPGTDFIPTFTIMWFYTHILINKPEDTIINVN